MFLLNQREERSRSHCSSCYSTCTYGRRTVPQRKLLRRIKPRKSAAPSEAFVLAGVLIEACAAGASKCLRSWLQVGANAKRRMRVLRCREQQAPLQPMQSYVRCRLQRPRMEAFLWESSTAEFLNHVYAQRSFAGDTLALDWTSRKFVCLGEYHRVPSARKRKRPKTFLR